MQIPEHFAELSIRMSEALDDIGAGKDTVMGRRRSFMWRDRIETIGAQQLVKKYECFHFGSQSEGTTTPGLQSDIDILLSNNNVNIMRLPFDWKAGMVNLLMLYDDITPPQQYLIQVIGQHTPEPEISLWDASGHLRAAVRVLEDVERRYHSKAKAVCGWMQRGEEEDRDLHVFASMTSGYYDNDEQPFVFCVKFCRQESYCTPLILLLEMNRNLTDEEMAHRKYPDTEWMDCAEVGARPFLNYLQYLTYGGLGERNNQLYALKAFWSYICDRRNITKLYHAETALNLLGHCYEMEGDFDRALNLYEISLRYRGTNNAANWHVQRVLRLISG